MTEAYYEPLGTEDGWELFRATPHTVSAWGPDLQHGAPPSAILTRAMERVVGAVDTRISRVEVDLLGAVPRGDLRRRARVTRPGKRIELVEAELEAGGRVVARASAWRMRASDTTEVEQTVEPVRQLPTSDRDSSFFSRWTSGYIDSLQIRGAEDGTVWARPSLPLVAGEPVTPIVQLMCVADIANGVGAVLEPTDWRFLNTDLITHVHRLPRGEWIGVRADASIGPDGVGTTQGTLFDENGALGHTLQALLIESV